jgi:hypothetical protein
MSKKVGFSASQCIADLLAGNVNFNDVVMITTGTRAESKEHWAGLIEQYHSMHYFPGPVEEAVAMGNRLWDAGVIHQPRMYGSYRIKAHYAWMDLVHTSKDRASNPALRDAWQQVQLLEGLIAGNILNDDMNHRDNIPDKDVKW